MLAGWLMQPHVRRFYQKNPITLDDVARQYGPGVRGEEPGQYQLALHGATPFAYLQCYRNVDYPQWGNIIDVHNGVSIDLYIGEPAYLRRGFGRAALRSYLRQVVFPSHADETRAYIGHELANTAALRCSQAVGFQPLRTFLENGIETLLLAIERSAIAGG